MTLFQSDILGNNLPSGYNTPERLDFVKSWIDSASDLGSQIIRIPGDWIGLELNGKGQYTESYVLEQIETIKYAGELGIQVIYEFAQTPVWARPAGGDFGSFTPPANNQDYADAVSYLHSRFLDANIDQYVEAWEIWNEPNVDAFWPGSNYRNPIDPPVDCLNRSGPMFALELASHMELSYGQKSQTRKADCAL